MVRIREHSQGKGSGGFNGYVKGMLGNPSLVKSLGKTSKSTDKPMKTYEHLYVNHFSLALL